MHPHDPTGDPARFGIPAHVIAELETSCHSATQEFDELAASELTVSSRCAGVNALHHHIIAQGALFGLTTRCLRHVCRVMRSATFLPLFLRRLVSGKTS
jgi:hypothetical protein